MDTTATPSKPVLPDFTRWSWASDAERQWWKPLFESATNAFQVWERLSVVQGLRNACWQIIPYQQLVEMSRWCAEHDLVCFPTHQVLSGSGYSSSDSQNGTLSYRCLIARPPVVAPKPG